MAGANNKAMAKAGMSRAHIEAYRAEPMDGVRMKRTANAVAMDRSPARQAAAADFRAKSAAGLRAMAAKVDKTRGHVKVGGVSDGPKLSAAKDALLRKLASRDKPYDADLGQEPSTAKALERSGLVAIERIYGQDWRRTKRGDYKRVATVSLSVTITQAGKAALGT